MNELMEMTELAARVLRKHPVAPRVAYVSVGYGSARGGLGVDFQLPGGRNAQQAVTSVARWAAALDTVVSVIDHDNYVEISAYATVDGGPVRVWDHLHGREIAELIMATGVDVYDTRTEFEPAVLLAAFAAEAVA
ncbi:hypothetical protein [Lentzea aerocolonigenes]|uniref:hypothetical protein n=1 Tax=Lentzea aerocolonigenes TaxID=68170 RepID=UPI0004C43687|nr:hypothetical protein [Lentzea aerocolonigenes]MCP2242721.1 hypothetical protein [Lentzea aerocolonigenes]